MRIQAYIALTTVITLSTTCMERESNIQEHKQLIQINSLTQPHTNNLKDLKEKLYTTAKNLDTNFDHSKIATHTSLINFITLMNQAKRFNISEYAIAHFVYSQEKEYNPIPLYFHCLEKYNNAKEQLPFTIDDLHNEFCYNTKLAQALKITYKYYSMQDIEDKLKAYPAYTNLIAKLKIAANQDNHYYNRCSDYFLNNALCVGLHSGIKTLLQGPPQYNDITNFDGFYAKAYEMQYPCYINMYLFIALIEHIKTIEKENDGKTMFSKILNYQPQQKEFFGIKYGSSVDVNLVSASTKNKMALRYRCVEEYNREKGDKITPTNEQHAAFLALKNLNILLPDDFDKTIFDENKYAFAEFEMLYDRLKTIYDAHEAQLAQNIKKILQQQES